ncbi:hypothetical protein Cpin_3866 [Chitinophaga pinensis DSM 2588]|uniref:Uncharacterized protein n=1 Tax=Chitinophaga pinensis (strain ATCC 43595 / DSM 2588 / LMG 13176 / NBRC 15968 / NCIMB 11800 / UQM 2034) TaxID=485918 RepID=A0A979G608_CHIPD|nr:hypothetical protein Cpin_3866 [Chitinophaga pinensis DSM 2588]
MITLLSLLKTAPLVVGAFVTVVTLIAILAPWGKLVKFMALTILIGLVCVVLFFEHIWKSFCRWMRKPEPWYDEFDKWMTENSRL